MILALVQNISQRLHVNIFKDKEKQKLTKTSEQNNLQSKNENLSSPSFFF